MIVPVIFVLFVRIIDSFVFLVIRRTLHISSAEMMSRSIYFLAVLVSKLVLFMLVALFKKFFKDSKEASGYISIFYWGIIIIQSGISLFAISVILHLSHNDSRIPNTTLLAAVGILLQYIASIWSIEYLADREKRVLQNSLIRQQMELALENTRTLSESFEIQQKTMHDFSNHISVLFNLLNTKQYSDASQYLTSISSDLHYSIYRIKTNHPIIDAILNEKDIQARHQNIELDIRASDLSSICIENALLVTIIGNVLNNAIESCSTMKPRIIFIKLVIENNILIFSVINPIVHKVKINNNMIETTKPDKTLHGLGLKNIAAALKKCNGEYEIGCTSTQFQFTSFIRL